jgi:hypothetical protein
MSKATMTRNQAIKMARELYQEGKAVRDIGQILFNEGYASPRGGPMSENGIYIWLNKKQTKLRKVEKKKPKSSAGLLVVAQAILEMDLSDTAKEKMLRTIFC